MALTVATGRLPIATSFASTSCGTAGVGSRISNQESLMLTAIKSSLRSVLGSFGVVKDASPREYVKTLLGTTELFAADVGAAGWLPPRWDKLEGVLNFLFFEPHPESYQKLDKRAQNCSAPDMMTVFNTALSGTGGKRTLHLLNTPTGSSLLPVDLDSEFVDKEDKYIFPIREVEVETRTLLDVLDEANQHLHMLKLDVQGAEYEILDGLGKTRRNDLVMVEAEVNIGGSIHVDAPTFNDIKEILTDAGLRLYDVFVVRTYRKKHGDKFWYHRNLFNVDNTSPSLRGRTHEFDVMYFKDYRPLIKEKNESQLRRLLVALCTYHYFSEAHFIIDKSRDAGLFDPDEAKRMQQAIVDWHNRSVRQFWYGRGAVAKLLRRLIRTTD